MIEIAYKTVGNFCYISPTHYDEKPLYTYFFVATHLVTSFFHCIPGDLERKQATKPFT